MLHKTPAQKKKQQMDLFSSVEKKVRFLMKTFQDLYHIVSFNGLQTVEGQNDSFSAASEGYKRYQTMNNSLI